MNADEDCGCGGGEPLRFIFTFILLFVASEDFRTGELTILDECVFEWKEDASDGKVVTGAVFGDGEGDFSEDADD